MGGVTGRPLADTDLDFTIHLLLPVQAPRAKKPAAGSSKQHPRSGWPGPQQALPQDLSQPAAWPPSVPGAQVPVAAAWESWRLAVLHSEVK